MRQFRIFLLLCLGYGQSGFAQPDIYINFLSHNEETASWDNVNYYTANRAKLIGIAQYFDSAGISWNMQSDWRYLKNSINNEVAPLVSNTNNKHILRWMYEDKGVEIDPHAHESLYLYPDVAKLLDSIGLPTSKIMGGSIYNDSNGVNIWTNLVNGQYGAVFPNYFWKPSYMMGGGTPNHVADLNYFGFWHPQSPATYTVHDTATPLVHFGTGCSFKIRDTTDVPSFMAEFRALIQAIKSGQYPSNGFYYQSVFFGQGDLGNVTLYNKIFEVADSLNALVASGDVQWKTMKQTYTLWENQYQKQMFQWPCGQLINAVAETPQQTPTIRIFPNPATDQLNIQAIDYRYPLMICKLDGKVVMQQTLEKEENTLSIGHLPKGFYILRNGHAFIKLVKE